MQGPPPLHSDGGGYDGEAFFLDEDDILDMYDVDDEDLPDADDDDGGEEEEDEIVDEIDDPVNTFTRHKGELYTAACSPTNPTLVATGGGDDKVFLWKIDTGDWVELQGHKNSVSSLSFSADGHLIASGGVDRVVKVWDIARGALRGTLDGPTKEIEWMRWHPREHLILAGSGDSYVWMWNADNGDCLRVFAGHGSSVTCGDFTPDGETICSGSNDGTMIIWNHRTGERIHVIGECNLRQCIGHPHHHTGGLRSLAITSDSSLALTGSSDGSAYLVNILTGGVVTALSSHSNSIQCASFEPSSSRHSWKAATGDMDGKLMIWDSQQRDHLRFTCDHHVHEGGVTSLLWLGLRYIATSCTDGKVQIWDSLSGGCVKKLRGHSESVQSIAASCNGDFLVSASYDKSALVFDLRSILITE